MYKSCETNEGKIDKDHAVYKSVTSNLVMIVIVFLLFSSYVLMLLSEKWDPKKLDDLENDQVSLDRRA